MDMKKRKKASEKMRAMVNRRIFMVLEVEEDGKWKKGVYVIFL